jgi:ribosome-associated protein
MRSEEIVDLAVSALDDLKALDVTVLDVRRLTDVTDFMVVATGNSDRQVRALAEEVVVTAKERGQPPLGVEGERDGEWVLVDLTDVVVHIMQPEMRDLYQLEKLWAAPIDPQGRAVVTQVLDTEAHTL